MGETPIINTPDLFLAFRFLELDPLKSNSVLDLDGQLQDTESA